MTYQRTQGTARGDSGALANPALVETANRHVLTAIETINAAEQFVAQGSRNQAIELYGSWLEANSRDSLAYAISFNLGVLLKDAGNDAGAEQFYRRAATLNPACFAARFNLGSQLEKLNRPQDAIAEWQGILDSPQLNLPKDQKILIMALNNIGRLQEKLRNYELAEQMLVKSLAVDPTQQDVMQHFIHLRQRQCEWPVYPDIAGIDSQTLFGATGMLSILAASGDPLVQRGQAEKFVESKLLKPVAPLAGTQCYKHDRLRVGYLSSDFCLHPVSMLTVELYELHDRKRVEVYGFCWSAEDKSGLRKRVVGAFDHYIRIDGMSDEAAAKCIRDHEIDVLVDLHGLTLGSRPNILIYRPAPIQMTYLGFPGTSCIPGVDYVIADRFLIPEEHRQNYSEKPFYMPNCFQISDRKREVGAKPTRASCGLPEIGFVFCSFNNNYKFTPEMFGRWMSILRRVPGSVLWLLADNAAAKRNLSRYALEQGVAPDRLIFAGRAAPPDYLARYQIADLFLDCYPFGGGATANDALSQSLPVLTYLGQTFSSRMGGSLLHGLGLHELITTSLEAYEEKAVELGNDRPRAEQLRRYLDDFKGQSAVFDSPRFVRDFENAIFELARESEKDVSAGGASMPVAGETIWSAQRDILELVKLVRPWALRRASKLRIGPDQDGGYVLPETALQCDHLLSIGAAEPWEFEREAARRGMDVLLASSDADTTQWIRRGDAVMHGPKEVGGDNVARNFCNLISSLRHDGAKRMLLKLAIDFSRDTVGAEWESAEFAAFESIVLVCCGLDQLAQSMVYDRAAKLLRRLSDAHSAVHVHGINYKGLVLVHGVPLPRALEITYLRKDMDWFSAYSNDPIPGPLDRPNKQGVADICLNVF